MLLNNKDTLILAAGDPTSSAIARWLVTEGASRRESLCRR